MKDIIKKRNKREEYREIEKYSERENEEEKKRKREKEKA